MIHLSYCILLASLWLLCVWLMLIARRSFDQKLKGSAAQVGDLTEIAINLAASNIELIERAGKFQALYRDAALTIDEQAVEIICLKAELKRN